MGGVTCSGEAALKVTGGGDLRPQPKAGVPHEYSSQRETRKEVGPYVTSAQLVVYFGSFGMQVQVYSSVKPPESRQGAACPAMKKGVIR
jgi:hypothetical protein